MALETRGIEAAIDLVSGLDRRVGRAAVRAVNRTARDQRTVAARRIGEQVALPRSYLGPSGGRLIVTQRAAPGSPVARITARSRPTSLARFVQGATGRPGRNRGAGLSVQVRPGRSVQLRRAFLIRLRRGAALTDTQYNLGLAIRLRPGESILNKYKQVQLSRRLYLLYGPSVQQVFLDNEGRGVAADIATPTAIKLEREFLRQLGL